MDGWIWEYSSILVIVVLTVMYMNTLPVVSSIQRFTSILLGFTPGVSYTTIKVSPFTGTSPSCEQMEHIIHWDNNRTKKRSHFVNYNLTYCFILLNINWVIEYLSDVYYRVCLCWSVCSATCRCVCSRLQIFISHSWMSLGIRTDRSSRHWLIVTCMKYEKHG